MQGDNGRTTRAGDSGGSTTSTNFAQINTGAEVYLADWACDSPFPTKSAAVHFWAPACSLVAIQQFHSSFVRKPDELVGSTRCTWAFKVPESGSERDIATHSTDDDPVLQQFKNVTPSSLAENEKARALEHKYCNIAEKYVHQNTRY